MPDKKTSSDEDLVEIVEQLKREVHRYHRERPGTEPARGPAVPDPTWLGALDQVYLTARVNPHLPIAWPTWPKGLLPKAVALTQKIVRRMLRWYINPIVEQQNRFNASVAQALQVLWQETSQLQMQLAQQEFCRGPENE